VDDVARFASPGVVLLAHAEDPATENHRRSADNLRRLELSKDSSGNALRVVTLPFPRAVTMDGVALPASYANFYIANDVVLVPTFNDRNDRRALETIAGCFPGHEVIGIHSLDLVWGFGTLHCLTQQQPTARAGRLVES
jgi:agmatine deiminase